MTTNGRAIIFTSIVFMVGLSMILFVIQAKAERVWPNSEFSRDVVVIKAKPRRHIKRPRKRTYKPRRKPRVKAWKRIRKPVLASGCKPTISVVGDQAPSEKGAKAQAQKAWSQQARYEVGERHADLRFAKDVFYSCVRSSIPNLATRTTEKLGISSQLKRCSISAQPCIAPVSR